MGKRELLNTDGPLRKVGTSGAAFSGGQVQNAGLPYGSCSLCVTNSGHMHLSCVNALQEALTCTARLLHAPKAGAQGRSRSEKDAEPPTVGVAASLGVPGTQPEACASKRPEGRQVHPTCSAQPTTICHVILSLLPCWLPKLLQPCLPAAVSTGNLLSRPMVSYLFTIRGVFPPLPLLPPALTPPPVHSPILWNEDRTALKQVSCTRGCSHGAGSHGELT